jgi:hypothetical protein
MISPENEEANEAFERMRLHGLHSKRKMERTMFLFSHVDLSPVDRSFTVLFHGVTGFSHEAVIWAI